MLTTLGPVLQYAIAVTTFITVPISIFFAAPIVIIIFLTKTVDTVTTPATTILPVYTITHVFVAVFALQTIRTGRRPSSRRYDEAQ